MKVSTTLKINPDKKELFESLEPFLPQGKRTLTDALDVGIDTILNEFASEDVLNQRILETELFLAKMKQQRDEFKFLREKQKRTKNFKNKEVSEYDAGLEKIRLEKFENKKDTLALQIRKGSLDWSKIAGLFMFNSPGEAREWIIPKLQEGRLLE